MEISPETKDIIKNSMSLLMNDDDVTAFSNLDHAITIIQQEQSCWQAPASIGVHAAALHLAEKTNDEEAILQDLIAYALEPLEALLGSLMPESDKETLEDERAHLLFHTRFGLGFLLLASGEEERAKTILHEMAATRLSARGAQFMSGERIAGPGIVPITNDIRQAKRLTAMLMLSVYERKEDYDEALYLVTEAAACNPWDTEILSLAPTLLDLWVEKCEKADSLDECFLDWLYLFETTADLISICQEADSSGILPDECKKESAQFLAWKFGQLVAAYALRDKQWHDTLFMEGLHKLPSGEETRIWVWDDIWSSSRSVPLVVGSLLSCYDDGRNWEMLREHYICMWAGSYTSYGAPLSEIGPESDLYWAMRIGFVDKMLETQQRDIIPVLVPTLPTIHSIEIAKDILSIIALRELKLQQSADKITERFPPGKREIVHLLEQWLSDVWVKLPAKVINTLVKAENYYKTEVDDDNAKVHFAKVVEASLNYCFVDPLVAYMQKRGYKEIAICFPPTRGRETKSENALRKLSLSEWAGILEMLTAPRVKGLSELGMSELLEFVKQCYRWQRLPDLHPLARSLQAIQKYRGGSAHDQEAISRYDQETLELEEMRKLVLGIGRDSVIAQIFKLFTPRQDIQAGNE